MLLDDADVAVVGLDVVGVVGDDLDADVRGQREPADRDARRRRRRRRRHRSRPRCRHRRPGCCRRRPRCRRCRCRPGVAGVGVAAVTAGRLGGAALGLVAALLELDRVVLDEADVALIGLDVVGVVVDDLHADVAGEREAADRGRVAAVAAVGVAALGLGVATEGLDVARRRRR